MVGAVPAIWAVYHSTTVMIANVKDVLDTLNEAMPSEKPGRFRTFVKLVMANRKEAQKLLKHLEALLDKLEKLNGASDAEDDDADNDEPKDNAGAEVLAAELRQIVEPLLAKLQAGSGSGQIASVLQDSTGRRATRRRGCQ